MTSSKRLSKICPGKNKITGYLFFFSFFAVDGQKRYLDIEAGDIDVHYMGTLCVQ